MPLLLKQCIFFGSDIYFIGNTFFYLKKKSYLKTIFKFQKSIYIMRFYCPILLALPFLMIYVLTVN